jgi:predicted RNase H-like nuclease (RuvC/YqgF family)
MIIEVELKEYAEKKKVSLSNVYQKIKRGTLQSIKKNGITYILEDIEEPLNETSKECKKDIKSLKKEIKFLKALLKSKDKEISTLEKSFQLFSMTIEKNLLSIENKTPDYVDVEVKPKKKKKK